MGYHQSFIVLAFLAACKGGPTDPDTDTDDVVPTGCAGDDDNCDADEICEQDECVEGDRNNSFDEAAGILQEQPADGEIEPRGDIDYYRYTATGPEWIRVNTTPDEAEGFLDTVVSIHNAQNGALHAWIDDYATGNVSNYDSVLYAYLPAGGDWIIAVQDRGTFFDDPDITEATGPYQVEVKAFSNVTDETDAIDDPSIDVDLDDGTTIYAVGVLIDEAGDADFVSVDIPWDRGPVEVAGMSEIPGSPLDAVVEVYDPDGVLASRKLGFGPDGWAYAFDTVSGNYTVAVSDADGDGGDSYWTVLYVRTRDDDYYGIQFEEEPNGDMATAFELDTETETTSSGTDYEKANFYGEIDAAADEDWWTLEIPENDYLTVWCSADALGSTSDVRIEVLDAEGNVLGDESDGSDDSPDISNITFDEDTTVYLRFVDEGGDVGQAAYYYCSAYDTPFEVN